MNNEYGTVDWYREKLNSKFYPLCFERKNVILSETMTKNHIVCAAREGHYSDDDNNTLVSHNSAEEDNYLLNNNAVEAWKIEKHDNYVICKAVQWDDFSFEHPFNFSMAFKHIVVVNDNLSLFNGKVGIQRLSDYIMWGIFKDGKLHCETSYALYKEYRKGGIENKEYFLGGKQLTLEQFWEQQKDTKYAGEIFSQSFAAENETVS